MSARAFNQYGSFPVYATEAARLEARRKSWRESARRRASVNTTAKRMKAYAARHPLALHFLETMTPDEIISAGAQIDNFLSVQRNDRPGAPSLEGEASGQIGATVHDRLR